MRHKTGLHSAALMMMGIVTALFSACGGGDDGGIPQTMTLSADAVTPSEAYLNWTAHPETITGYDVVRNGVAVNPTHLSGTSLTDNELEPSTHYCYIVYAVVWPIGTVGQSNPFCITTSATAGWSIDTIDVGSHPALALDASNQPHVSYTVAHNVITGDRLGVRCPV